MILLIRSVLTCYAESNAGDHSVCESVEYIDGRTVDRLLLTLPLARHNRLHPDDAVTLAASLRL